MDTIAIKLRQSICEHLEDKAEEYVGFLLNKHNPDNEEAFVMEYMSQKEAHVSTKLYPSPGLIEVRSVTLTLGVGACVHLRHSIILMYTLFPSSIDIHQAVPKKSR